MPYKMEKRVGPLQRLCEETILHKHFDQLKNHLGRLPFVVLDELRGKAIHFPLQSEIFINSHTQKIDCVTFLERTVQYDLPIGPFFDRIGNVCKNLTTLKIVDEINNITNQQLEALIPNIPNIRILTIKSAGVQDLVLYQIGTHCPQLQTLDLNHCEGVTDNGISLLCTLAEDRSTSRNLKIVDLNITSTSVTGRGCVTALRNLTLLEHLRSDQKPTSDAMVLLRRDLRAVGSENASPIPSLLTLGNFSFNDEADLKIAIALFPNLTMVPVGKVSLPIRLFDHLPKFRQLKKIAIFSKETIDLNRLLPKLGPQIEEIFLGNSIFDIQLAGALCPMLKSFCVSGTHAAVPFDDDLFAERPINHVPFSHLTMLVESCRPGTGCGHLIRALKNAKKLERLQLIGLALTDEQIDDVLASNRMARLKVFVLMRCNLVTGHSVMRFLELDNPMDSVVIDLCPRINNAVWHCEMLKYIHRNKLNVTLRVTLV